MRLKSINGLPGLGDVNSTLSLRVQGVSAYVRTPRFLARIALETGSVDWLVERPLAKWDDTTLRRMRTVHVSGRDLWSSADNRFVAEVLPATDGALLVSCQQAETGQRLWEERIAMPGAEEWSEPWPEAGPLANPVLLGMVEPVSAFVADNPETLVVCLLHESRRVLDLVRIG